MIFKSVIFRLYLKSDRFDNDFAIKSKYHRDLCYLVLIAHILSLQDVTIRSMFCALFYQIVCCMFVRWASNFGFLFLVYNQ